MAQSEFKTAETFTEDLCAGKHAVGSHSFKAVLASSTTKTDGPAAKVSLSKSRSGRVVTVKMAAAVVTADEDFSARRYALIVNETSGAVVGWFDYGESFPMRAGDRIEIAASGLFTL